MNVIVLLIVVIGICDAAAPTLTLEMMKNWDLAWQKFDCEKQQVKSFMDGIKACFSYMSADVFNALLKCREESFENPTDIAAMVEEGCKKDYDKYNTCMLENYKDSQFLAKIVESRDAYDCFDKISKANGATFHLFEPLN